MSQPIRNIEEAQPVPGRDLVLTLDAQLQGVAERALEGRVSELVRSGLARPSACELDSSFLDLPRPADPEGRSLEAALEERGESW